MEFSKKIDAITGEALFCGVHKSGVRVYIMPKEGFRKSTAMFATAYGSIDTTYVKDGEEHNIPDGTAHFLEHKLFEDEDGDAFSKFSVLGANANAFTSFATTAYHFSATDNFLKSLETLIKFVQSPYFTKESIAKEQGIIGQEIKMYDDDPSWRVYFNAIESLYHNNPVKIDIAGTCESISTITKEVLYDIYNMYYHPSNMVLFVAGDVDVCKVGEVCDKSFKDIAPLPEKIRKKVIDEPDSIVRSKVSINLDVSMPMFNIAFKDTDMNLSSLEQLKKEIETDVLIEMLFGKGSKIYKELYNSGLINDTFSTEYSCNSAYAFSCVGGDSKNPDAVYEKILSMLEGDFPGTESFERAKKCIWGEYIGMFDSTDSIVYSFALHQLAGIDMLDFKRVYDSISYDDVLKRKAKLFCRERSCLSVVMPEK